MLHTAKKSLKNVEASLLLMGPAHVDKNHPSNKTSFDAQITDVQCPRTRNDWRARTKVDNSASGSSSKARN